MGEEEEREEAEFEEEERGAGTMRLPFERKLPRYRRAEERRE